MRKKKRKIDMNDREEDFIKHLKLCKLQRALSCLNLDMFITGIKYGGVWLLDACSLLLIGIS